MRPDTKIWKKGLRAAGKGIPGAAYAGLHVSLPTRRALAIALDIEQKRAQAQAIGFDIEPVLEQTRRLTRETAMSWGQVFPLLWDRAYEAACRGEEPAPLAYLPVVNHG